MASYRDGHCVQLDYLHTYHNGNHSTRNHRSKFPVSKGMQDELAHVQLPTFESSFTDDCLDEYLFWILEVDNVLDSFSCSEVSKYHCVVKSLTGLAKLWWDGVQILRVQQGLMKINTWTAMRNILQQCFYSDEKRNYQLNLLARCSQGARCVSDYADEFQILALRSSVPESSQDCINLFLNGLKPEFADAVRGKQPSDFCETVILALKEEKRFAKRKMLSVSQQRFSTEPTFIKAKPLTDIVSDNNLAMDHHYEPERRVEFSSDPSNGSAQQHLQIGTMFISVPMELTQECCHQSSAPNNAPSLKMVSTEPGDSELAQITTVSIGITTQTITFKPSLVCNVMCSYYQSWVDMLPTALMTTVIGLMIPQSYASYFSQENRRSCVSSIIDTLLRYTPEITEIRETEFHPSLQTLNDAKTETTIRRLELKLTSKLSVADYKIWFNLLFENNTYEPELSKEITSHDRSIYKSWNNPLFDCVSWDLTYVDESVQNFMNPFAGCQGPAINTEKDTITLSQMQSLLQTIEVAPLGYEPYAEQVQNLCTYDVNYATLTIPCCGLSTIKKNDAAQVKLRNDHCKGHVLKDGRYHHYHLNGD